MRSYIGITDIDWFSYLSSKPGVDEVNFWRPGGNSVFRAINPGELFLFKLHSPSNFIVGGGIFTHFSILPVSVAWESFGEKNGAISLADMRTRVDKYRPEARRPNYDYNIGCILLSNPFFFQRPQWVPAPRDFSMNIVQGKTYDLSIGAGKELWQALSSNLPASPAIQLSSLEERKRTGSPITVFPRLGQGSFRVLITDLYKRRCAVTGEKTLPALDAAHIKPFNEDGPHQTSNGILLRSDIHKLFDRGYVTITPDYHFEVSKRIREEFENGHEYYALHGSTIQVPSDPHKPNLEYLRYHREHKYLG